MEITWQNKFASRWLAAAKQDRLPHAVLLAGPVGVGKRAAAVWMVARKLRLTRDSLPQFPFERPEHADLHWLCRPEDKTSILIDQVRMLVNDLSLTSYSGHGKAAVIEPAHLMTNSAANGLLKTLEEPPGDTLLVLIADRIGRLPATIFSRCQRVEIRVPPEDVSLAWLDRTQPGRSWIEPLRIAGYAPLAAIDAVEQLETSNTMTRDFSAVAAGTASPVEVAATWARLETPFVLNWLARHVQQVAKAAVLDEPGSDVPGIGKSVLQRMDRRNVFCYLDQINRLRCQPKGSFNVPVALEGLLIDWAAGLAEVDPERMPAALMLTRNRSTAGP